MLSNLTIWVAKVLQISSETVGEEVEGKKPIVVKSPQYRHFRALGLVESASLGTESA